MECDPKSAYGYIELGRLYRDNLNLVEAENLLNDGIKANPESDGAYRELAWFYAERGDFLQAEDLYKKAAELDPRNPYNYIELGRFYVNCSKDNARAESCFKKAIEIDPACDRSGAYHELGRLYRALKRYPQAEECFKKAIEINPVDDKAWGGLVITYEEAGAPAELRERSMHELQVLRSASYNPITRANYLAIKKILDKRGIKLICVQYPLRSIAPLKEWFRDEGGLIFVDNEKIFKDAVSRSCYDDYFIDMFAGDFGHCTPKGNRILAANIADAIVKTVTGK